MHAEQVNVTAAVERPVDIAEGFTIFGALLCLVHCLFLPIVLAWMPLLSRSTNLGINLHLWVVCIAGPVSAWLLISAVRQYKRIIVSVGMSGLALLILALLWPLTTQQETLVSVAGSVMLAGAHLGNWWVRHRSHRHKAG